jgi:peptidyl-prolyl cis-trans isomerase C
MRGRHALLVVVALGACKNHERAATPAEGPLPPGVLARVGDQDIREESVQRIAAAQGVDAREARKRAIIDALFALERRSDPESAAEVTSSERSVLARVLLERIRTSSRADGPPTNAEIEIVTRERWPVLDRPPSVRTTHAVARVKEPKDRERARAVGTRLREALKGVSKPGDFFARAKELSTQEIEVRAERLPLLAPDGRTFELPKENGRFAGDLGSLDPTFTRAAHELETPGETSPLVETPFGFHVILLEERLPELRVSIEERRQLLADEIVSRRAKRVLSELVSRLEAETPVEEARDAESLTAMVPVAP